MKKRIRTWMGVVLSASMVMGSGIQAMAVNQFSVDAEDVGGKVLFPGDSVAGMASLYLGPDGAQQDISSGSWTNSGSQAYTMSGVEGEEGGLWLEPAGYVLTVNGGTSKTAGTDGSDKSNHYQPKNGEEETGGTPKDIAYYQSGTDVTVTAGAPQEGKVFDHWEIESANVTLADGTASETNFTMAEGSVILTAVYADVSTEPPTEATEATEPTEATEATEATEWTEATEPTEWQETTEATEPTEWTEPTEGTGSTEAIQVPGETEPIVIETPTETQGNTEASEETGQGDDNVLVIGGEEGTGGEDPSDLFSEAYEVTVENGSGSGSYGQGDTVSITADEVEGMVFAGWTTDSETVWFADSTAVSTTFSMPAAAVKVTANYVAAQSDENQSESQENNGSDPVLPPEIYQVTVENSEGSSQYEVGATVTIIADEPQEGMRFSHWEATENVTLADPYSQETSFVMPASEVKVTAVYQQAESDTEALTEVPEGQGDADGETEALTEGQTETTGESEASSEDMLNGGAGDGTEQSESQAATEIETEAQSESTVDNGAETVPSEPVTEAPETEAQEPEVLEDPETETEAGQDVQAQPETFRVSLSDDVTIESGASAQDKGDGAGSQYYAEAGATVTVTAEEYEYLVFTGWNVVRDDTQQEIAVNELDTDYLSGTFIMPNSSVTVEAVYEELEYNEVQVINGSGSGTYTEGDYVEIKANDAPTGQRFKKWTVITGDITLDDASAKKTGFTMTSEAVQVKAEYEMIPYTLTVTNGSGSGTYTMGQTVNLTANYPASGKVFAGWVVKSENGSVASADRYYSSITMPAADVTVEATYKDGPSPAYNRIDNIAQNGEYLKGSKISFTAVGNGMGNTNPNPGDYRYRPTGYQISKVTGYWDNSSSNYTTTMQIDTLGQYTLTVTYAKDVFDGSNWVADGTTDTKSVTFNVVNALSVQTGDNTPILIMACVGAVALLVIVILVVVIVRRRRRG